MSVISQGGHKVVFWLGAGASHNALPIVNEMPVAFLGQAQHIDEQMFNRGLADFKRYTAYLKKMADWSWRYGSIDTYARSLFLLKREKELAELKLHLSMFFMLSQVISP